MSHNVPESMKLPRDPQRRQQVRTFVERYGRQRYSEIGRRDGRPTPASFDSERAKAAAAKSVEARRRKKLEKEKQQSENRNQNQDQQANKSS